MKEMGERIRSDIKKNRQNFKQSVKEFKGILEDHVVDDESSEGESELAKE